MKSNIDKNTLFNNRDANLGQLRTYIENIDTQDQNFMAGFVYLMIKCHGDPAMDYFKNNDLKSIIDKNPGIDSTELTEIINYHIIAENKALMNNEMLINGHINDSFVVFDPNKPNENASISVKLMVSNSLANSQSFIDKNLEYLKNTTLLDKSVSEKLIEKLEAIKNRISDNTEKISSQTKNTGQQNLSSAAQVVNAPTISAVEVEKSNAEQATNPEVAEVKKPDLKMPEDKKPIAAKVDNGFVKKLDSRIKQNQSSRIKTAEALIKEVKNAGSGELSPELAQNIAQFYSTTRIAGGTNISTYYRGMEKMTGDMAKKLSTPAFSERLEHISQDINLESASIELDKLIKDKKIIVDGSELNTTQLIAARQYGSIQRLRNHSKALEGASGLDAAEVSELSKKIGVAIDYTLENSVTKSNEAKDKSDREIPKAPEVAVEKPVAKEAEEVKEKPEPEVAKPKETSAKKPKEAKVDKEEDKKEDLAKDSKKDKAPKEADKDSKADKSQDTSGKKGKDKKPKDGLFKSSNRGKVYGAMAAMAVLTALFAWPLAIVVVAVGVGLGIADGVKTRQNKKKAAKEEAKNAAMTPADESAPSVDKGHAKSRSTSVIDSLPEHDKDTVKGMADGIASKHKASVETGVGHKPGKVVTETEKSVPDRK